MTSEIQPHEGYVGPWTPHTAYAEKDRVLWPDGTVRKALVNHISSDQPEADKWDSGGKVTECRPTFGFC